MITMLEKVRVFVFGEPELGEFDAWIDPKREGTELVPYFEFEEAKRATKALGGRHLPKQNSFQFRDGDTRITYVAQCPDLESGVQLWPIGFQWSVMWEIVGAGEE